MLRKKITSHEFMLNPLIGLTPLISVSLFQIIWGLNIALHLGMMLSIILLIKNYFDKAFSYQAIVLMNLFIFAAYQYSSVHVFNIPDGSIQELLIYHVLVLLSIIISFMMKNLLFSFFDKQFPGSSKHMESNLKEFYFISKFIFLVMAMHLILFASSWFIPLIKDLYKKPIVDYLECVLLVCLVILELFRVNNITKMLKAEEFWPIVNSSGVVIGRVARSISLSPSNHKELHPVVRVHLINKGMVYLFKPEERGLDTKWDCPINEHVMYGETMDQAIIRVSGRRYGMKHLKPHFLLKHVVEQKLEKQYILLYYVSDVETLKLTNASEGQLKPWPMWQIEENLKKGVFSTAFEVEYEYIKNTVLLAEQFSKSFMEND